MKPDGIIELPEATLADLELLRRVWAQPTMMVLPPGARYSQISPWRHPRLGAGPDTLGLQYLYGKPTPTTPFQRYLHDLYGPPRRDWLPVFSYGLLAALVALPAALALILTGVL